MKVTLPYGPHKTVSFTLPDRNFDGLLEPNPVQAAPDPEALIAQAIDHPIGSPPLGELVRPGQRVNILCDDISRPTPVALILPVLTARLNAAGVRDEDIKIVMALGSHRYMTPAEMEERVGAEAYRRFRVVNSEFKRESDLVYAGRTPDGVDIIVSREAMDADVRIGVGNIVPHPVMGWSGGGKILFPGVTGEKTVAQFHMLGGLSDENLFGREDCSIRLRMENWVDTIGLHFIINTVLTPRLEIYKVAAGHYVAAQRAGVAWAKEVLCCPMGRRADVIVVSSYPADGDFWQSGKGYWAAEHGLKDENSAMVLVAPNDEGMGPHEEYGRFFGRDDAGALLRRLYEGEDIPGDPLALAVGASMSKMRRRRRLILVSDGVTRAEAEACGIAWYPVSALQQAVDDTLARYDDPVTAAMSHGGEFLPVCL